LALSITSNPVSSTWGMSPANRTYAMNPTHRAPLFR